MDFCFSPNKPDPIVLDHPEGARNGCARPWASQGDLYLWFQAYGVRLVRWKVEKHTEIRIPFIYICSYTIIWENSISSKITRNIEKFEKRTPDLLSVIIQKWSYLQFSGFRRQKYTQPSGPVGRVIKPFYFARTWLRLKGTKSRNFSNFETISKEPQVISCDPGLPGPPLHLIGLRILD